MEEWIRWCLSAAERYLPGTWEGLATRIDENFDDPYIKQFWQVLTQNDFPTNDLGLATLVKTEAYSLGWRDPYVGAGNEEWERIPVTTIEGDYYWDGSQWVSDDAWWALLYTFRTSWNGSDPETWESLVLDPLESLAKGKGLSERFERFRAESQEWDTTYAKQYLQWCGVDFLDPHAGQTGSIDAPTTELRPAAPTSLAAVRQEAGDDPQKIFARLVEIGRS